MTNPDLTLIGVLVDRSGSMASCKKDMEGGLRTLLKEQAKAPNPIEVTLAQFDTVYDIVYPPTPIKKAPTYTLTPRGGTALLDGMGRFITEVGEALAAQNEDQRPGKVLMCFLTDGGENSSVDWTRDKVKDLITQQHDDYQWEFVFLGANMDAVAEARSVGIPTSSSLTFDTANVRGTMDSFSNYASTYNVAGAAAFTDEDRKKAVSPSTP